MVTISLAVLVMLCTVYPSLKLYTWTSTHTCTIVSYVCAKDMICMIPTVHKNHILIEKYSCSQKSGGLITLLVFCILINVHPK